MKIKIKTMLLLSLLAINTLFAITDSSLYDRDSFLVTTINHLARSSKITGIYDSFPTAGASVLTTFNQIDHNKLNANEKLLYNKIEKELYGKEYMINTDDGFAANIKIPITLESTYYETSDNSKLKRYELISQFKDVEPWLNFNAQLYFGENLYGYSQLAIKDKLTYTLTDDAPNLTSNRLSLNFRPFSEPNQDNYYPYKVGLSAGNKHYNFQIGRNRLSTGSGISGNFFIGDNFTKQDYSSFSLLSPIVSYTVSVTLFDQQKNSLNFDGTSFNGMQQYRVMHKAKINLLKNLSLDIYQGALFQVDSFNFRMAIPFMLIHNYFNFADREVVSGNDEANNVLGVQAKWVFSKGKELNLILTLDQIQVGNESTDVFPQAYGFLANYKTTKILEKGILSESVEAVYTSPYLYLNKKAIVEEIIVEGTNGLEKKEIVTTSYNYDHIYGNHYGKYSEIGYGGYVYGPNTLMLAYNINYLDFDNWNLGTSLSLRVHGTTGIKVLDDYNDTIPDNLSSKLITGIPEYIIQLAPNFSINLTKFFTIKGNLELNLVANHYHKTSAPLFLNVQGNLGVSINIL